MLKFAALASAVVLSLAVPLAAQPADAAPLPLSDIKPGQHGEVWTVFEGNKIEPFAVEVTGVLQNALVPASP